MERRQLGNTGLVIPRVVFGATTLGNLFRVVPEQSKSEIVRAWLEAVEAPIVIDSAGKYGAGLSLEVIGRELERLDIRPDQVIISNKLAWRRVPLSGPEPTFEPGAWFGLQNDAVQDISRGGILRCWEEGNQLLGRYTAQMVSVHDPDEYLAAASNPRDRLQRLADIRDAYQALQDLKSQGHVTSVGVGAKNWRTIRELQAECRFDWVMFANSFTMMSHPEELAQFMTELQQQGVGIINSALFHGGFLTGGDFYDYRRVDPQNSVDQQRLAWRSRYQDICRQFGVSPFHVGVAFGLSHPAVTAVALSSSQADRVASHVEAASQPVPRAIWKVLAEANMISPTMAQRLQAP